MRIVHFGAGNIGRGAIPEIFDKLYSHLTFIDSNQELVNVINETKRYKIINDKNVIVSNYSAIHLSNTSKIMNAIENADLITTSCGINNLEAIANILNNIIQLKNKPIVIAFENNIRPSSYMKNFIKNKNYFIFMDCTIDRIVPKQPEHISLLDVKTESYLSVILEKSNEVHDWNWFKNFTIVESLDNYISLKLYGVNGLHFVISILAYNLGIHYIHLAFKNDVVQSYIHTYLKFLTLFLIEEFKFDKIYISNYLNENLRRFANPDLYDECTRIARNSLLKLSPNNRVVPIFVNCFKSKIILENEKNIMKKILIELISYKNINDNDSIELQNKLRNNSIEQVIESITGISI